MTVFPPKLTEVAERSMIVHDTNQSAGLAFVFWKLGSFGKRSAELKAQKT